MATSTTAVLCFFLFLLPLSINAAIFQIVNNCSFTVWAAWATTGSRAGGGNQLNPGQSWTINVNANSTGGRIWARTGCSSDGRGCQTGDCGMLRCQGYGQTPNTIAEFSLNQNNNNLDFFDISNVDGYNVGIDFSPTTGGCRGIRCSADIVGECPAALRAPGGCNNPCTVFGTSQYCCTQGPCGPTNYSSDTGVWVWGLRYHRGETTRSDKPQRPSSSRPGYTLPIGSFKSQPGYTLPIGSFKSRPGYTLPIGSFKSRPEFTLPIGSFKSPTGIHAADRGLKSPTGIHAADRVLHLTDRNRTGLSKCGRKPLVRPEVFFPSDLFFSHM